MLINRCWLQPLFTFFTKWFCPTLYISISFFFDFLPDTIAPLSPLLLLSDCLTAVWSYCCRLPPIFPPQQYQWQQQWDTNEGEASTKRGDDNKEGASSEGLDFWQDRYSMMKIDLSMKAHMESTHNMQICPDCSTAYNKTNIDATWISYCIKKIHLFIYLHTSNMNLNNFNDRYQKGCYSSGATHKPTPKKSHLSLWGQFMTLPVIITVNIEIGEPLQQQHHTTNTLSINNVFG